MRLADATDSDQVAWYNAWGQLKQVIQRLDSAVSSLQANASFALSRPNLADAWREKMAEVESMKSKAIWVRDAIRNTMSAVGVELSGIGALPIAAAVLWPAVAGAVAWLGSKALDLYSFAQQVDEQRRLEQSGVAPREAADIVTRKAESGSLTGLLKAAGPVLIGAGLLGVGFYLWKQHKRGG